MRVAILTNTYPPHDISGVGTLVAELAAQLPAAGHQAVVLTRRAAPDDPAARTTGGSKLLFPLAVTRPYFRAVREAPFDVVHVHESDGILVALLVRLARLLGRPSGRALLVATLQVSYARERRAVRPVRSDGRVVSRPTRSERVFAWGRAPVLAVLGRLTARLADRVVAPSYATGVELAQDYGARGVAVIPNGIAPLPAGEPPAEPLGPIGSIQRPPGGPVVLYAGRLRTRKGVAVLLEAFARLRGEQPGATLVLAGDGEQRSALETQARALGLGDAVRFAGAQPRGAMAGWYAAADVFCLPSLYEGFPLAILEAMAAGLPVVATAVAGIPEAVEDGVTGRLVPPEDAAALARALAELAADPTAARRMGAAGRRRVEEEFAIPRIAAAYLELWENSPERRSTESST